MESIEVKSFGSILPKKGSNGRSLYEHQRKAIENLDIINKSNAFSTLVVLPTGGGKTYTASLWLLKNAIDRNKKILWIAHRQMLLDQAAESFKKYAYEETISHISSFKYRIISGSNNHDRVVNINESDNLLIISKDSVGRNLAGLNEWIKNEKELYFVIDEAHHSTAKTYRKVIDYIKLRVPNLKIIGLTATPFRTALEEQGLLSKIFTDGVSNGQVVKGDIGITYKIGLKELINRQILSKPIFESYFTEELFGESLGINALNSIQNLDIIPEDIANQMANRAARNKFIVNTYKAKQKEYGQTIIFTVNKIHAIQLHALFEKSRIKAEYIVSEIKDEATGVVISREENERKLEDYRQGKVQVLINVNILTEGVDLPQTKTVFLARPTMSTILMTQMIGRALRGEAAGGTPTAHIVSFVDNWMEHIAWINPDSLFGLDGDFDDNEVEREKHEIRLISISKIEEFASILDEAVDTTALERVSFIKRIPIGMYAFTYLEENGLDISYQVMVYDSTQKAYQELMDALPSLFEINNAEDEYLSDKTLNDMCTQCTESFFYGEMIPPCENSDIINIIKYYAQYDETPKFYTFDEINRNKLDVSQIAKYIWDVDMGPQKKATYVDSLWESSNDDVLKLFFGKKLYFWKQLDIELLKLSNPEIYQLESNIIQGTRNLEDFSLYNIGKIDPENEKRLRDFAFENSRNSKGEYECANCGISNKSKIIFQVDHIIPMNKGGKSREENLQILCRRCNQIKGDR